MILVVEFKELYEAWENQRKSFIDDFRQDNGQITPVTQSDWF